MVDGNSTKIMPLSFSRPLLMLLIVIDHGVGTYDETNDNNGLVCL